MMARWRYERQTTKDDLKNPAARNKALAVFVR
jgi:hypothetical protein